MVQTAYHAAFPTTQGGLTQALGGKVNFIANPFKAFRKQSDASLLKLHLWIFGLIAFAHTLGTILAVRQEHDYSKMLAGSLITVPTAITCFALALLSKAGKFDTLRTLRIHTVVLSLAALLMIVYAVWIICNGISLEQKFSWNPVLFAFVLAYPALLILRFFPKFQDKVPGLRHSPLGLVILSAILSSAIMWRLFSAVAT